MILKRIDILKKNLKYKMLIQERGKGEKEKEKKKEKKKKKERERGERK